MANPEEFPTLYPFRLHYSDGTTADISATSAEAARKAGQVQGLIITKCKILKERSQ